jgi:hypothetical protein
VYSSYIWINSQSIFQDNSSAQLKGSRLVEGQGLDNEKEAVYPFNRTSIHHVSLRSPANRVVSWPKGIRGLPVEELLVFQDSGLFNGPSAKMNQTSQHVSFPPQPPPPPRNQQPETISKPRKLRRISRACDFCHKRSIRCKPSTEDPSRCQNCLDFGVGCTYNRPAKKRGIKSGTAKPLGDNGNEPSPRDGESDARMLLELTNGIQGNGNFNVVDRFSIPGKWKSMVLANERKIQDLVEVYFEVVYPM